jgi:hypothetical protein
MGDHVAPNIPEAPLDAASGEKQLPERASRPSLSAWWRSLTRQQRRGFAFWGPVGLAIGAVELAGALSGAFRNFIPWPTISSTIGHIEEVASWVGVIVVAVIAMVAYYAVTRGLAITRGIDPNQQTDHGRLLPPNVEKSDVANIKVRRRFFSFRYDWIFVFSVTAAITFLVARFWSDEKLVLGYSIYGSFLVFGILIPSALVRWAHLDARFPSLWIPVSALNERYRVTPFVLAAGLSILVIHLALYPWPDITRESTSYAGLTARDAQSKAVKQIRQLRASMPQLRYSTQARGVADGRDAWLVYFAPASGSGAAPYSGCVVIVRDDGVTPSAECSK